MISNLLKKIGIPESVQKRTQFMWTLFFLYQIGFIFSWVVITSIFIEYFGVENILVLFFIEAFLLIVGSFILKPLFLKINTSRFLVGISLCLFLLILSGHFVPNFLSFFVLALMAKSLIYPGLKIGFLRKLESLFSPSTARKSFPFVESAVTIGNIFGSALVLALLPFFDSQAIYFFWLLPVFGILFLLFRQHHYFNTISGLPATKKESKNISYRSGIFMIQKSRFLKIFAGILLLKSVIFTAIEFEFIHSINEHSHKDVSQKEILISDKDTKEKSSKVVLQMLMADSFIKESPPKIFAKEQKPEKIAEKSMIHELGFLSFIFGIIALFVQFIITPRIISRKGLFPTVCIYFLPFAFILLIPVLFGWKDINIIRGYEHGALSLFLAPIHLSLYGYLGKEREFLRHFFEGIISPLGVILAIGILFFLPTEFYLLVSLIGILLVFLFLERSEKFYEDFSMKNFLKTQDINQRLHMLEIFSLMKKNSIALFLAEFLEKSNKKNTSLILRQKIVQTLKKIGKPQVIHSYLNILSTKKESREIKISVLESILHFPNMKTYFEGKVFTQTEFFDLLVKMFGSADSAHLKKVTMMNIFAHLPCERVTEFLKEILSKKDAMLTSICLRSCMNFNDPEMIRYLKKYINSKNSRISSHAIMACWKYGNQEKLRQKLYKFLESKNESKKISAVYALGEVKDKISAEKIKKVIENAEGILKVHGLIALAKIEVEGALFPLAEIIAGENKVLAQKAFHMRKRIACEQCDKLDTILHGKISEKVNSILSEKNIRKIQDVQKLSAPQLSQLKVLYEFSGMFENIYILDRLLQRTKI